MKTALLRFFQGALVGAGAILPGVSGGVLCAAFGIYEPMMELLSHPFKAFKKNFWLLLPVVIGGGFGFIILAKAVEALLTFSSVAAIALFCGLICGTVPDLARKATAEEPQRGWMGFIIALIFSFALFRFLEGSVAGSIQPNWGWYMFCGLAWALSMIVPGLSSSSILLFLGLYQPMTQGIGNLDFGVLIPMGIGFLLTIAAAARGVDTLIKRYNPIFSKVILGFVLSSVLVILPVSEMVGIQMLVGVASFVIGFALAILMNQMESKYDLA